MGQYLATVRPRIDTANATAYAQHDLLFDWHRFEIPNGEACIKKCVSLIPLYVLLLNKVLEIVPGRHTIKKFDF